MPASMASIHASPLKGRQVAGAPHDIQLVVGFADQVAREEQFARHGSKGEKRRRLGQHDQVDSRRREHVFKCRGHQDPLVNVPDPPGCGERRQIQVGCTSCGKRPPAVHVRKSLARPTPERVEHIDAKPRGNPRDEVGGRLEEHDWFHGLDFHSRGWISTPGAERVWDFGSGDARSRGRRFGEQRAARPALRPVTYRRWVGEVPDPRSPVGLLPVCVFRE
jgi:hypothetical protein